MFNSTFSHRLHREISDVVFQLFRFHKIICNEEKNIFDDGWRFYANN